MSRATGDDITELILSQHEDFRRRFVDLWDLRPEGDVQRLDAAWRELANLLEVHASAEEEILYPVLLKKGGDDAAEETLDAVGDHNEIRDAVRKAARHVPSSAAWWDAVLECREANDEHLAEEERDVIPDFREHSDATLRGTLGEAWIEFDKQHAGARGISGDDVDPDDFVKENS
ncbi:MAG: hemerythrin domain-containing protein [bacterium]|nr:hemerythrin domain-containing protein [bacterium]